VIRLHTPSGNLPAKPVCLTRKTCDGRLDDQLRHGDVRRHVATKSTAAATSSGWLQEGGGLGGRCSSLTGCGRTSRIGVFTSPGYRLLTRMPLSLSSAARQRPSALMPNFEAE